jgi:hypothetical protein
MERDVSRAAKVQGGAQPHECSHVVRGTWTLGAQSEVGLQLVSKRETIRDDARAARAVEECRIRIRAGSKNPLRGRRALADAIERAEGVRRKVGNVHCEAEPQSIFV